MRQVLYMTLLVLNALEPSDVTIAELDRKLLKMTSSVPWSPQVSNTQSLLDELSRDCFSKKKESYLNRFC